MITTVGRTHIKRYLAGFVPAIARSVAFGIGEAAPTVSDQRLQFEVARGDVTLVSYDFVNDKLIFKANVPDEAAGKIYEVGIFSLSSDYVSGEFSDRLIANFDADTETWVDATTAVEATYSTANARIGQTSLRHTPAASGTKTDALRDIVLDLSGYSAADRFVLAATVGNGNTSSIRVRFLTDATNYYELNYGAVGAGVRFLSANKGSATVTGTPSWANITEIRITTNSTASGASQVDYEGLRVENAEPVSPDYVMVARSVLTTPFTVQPGTSQEMEFAVGVNIA